MHTSCRWCVFSQDEGDTQVGCDFDRIDKFEKLGVEVVGEDDGEKKYLKIIGRICNCCRHPKTLEKIPPRKWMEHVKREITVRVAMAAYFDDDNSLDEVEKTIDSFYVQHTLPYEIIVINNSSRSNSDFVGYLADGTIPWRVEQIKGTVTPDGEYQQATFGDAVDLTVKAKGMKATYFTVCHAGFSYPTDFIGVIDTAINENLEVFVALHPQDEAGNGLFVQTALHNLIGGNKPVEGCGQILDKIAEIAALENASHTIKRFEDLRESCNHR